MPRSRALPEGSTGFLGMMIQKPLTAESAEAVANICIQSMGGRQHLRGAFQGRNGNTFAVIAVFSGTSFGPSDARNAVVKKVKAVEVQNKPTRSSRLDGLYEEINALDPDLKSCLIADPKSIISGEMKSRKHKIYNLVPPESFRGIWDDSTTIEGAFTAPVTATVANSEIQPPAGQQAAAAAAAAAAPMDIVPSTSGRKRSLPELSVGDAAGMALNQLAASFAAYAAANEKIYRLMGAVCGLAENVAVLVGVVARTVAHNGANGMAQAFKAPAKASPERPEAAALVEAETLAAAAAAAAACADICTPSPVPDGAALPAETPAAAAAAAAGADIRTPSLVPDGAALLAEVPAAGGAAGADIHAPPHVPGGDALLAETPAAAAAAAAAGADIRTPSPVPDGAALLVLQMKYAKAALQQQGQLLRLLRAAAAEGRVPADEVEAAAENKPELNAIVKFQA